jgi:hypothetical protein
MRILQITLGLFVVAITYWIETIWGFKKGSFNAGLEENKVAASCLRSDDVNLSKRHQQLAPVADILG